jgi:hypothetical protein
MMSDTHHQIDPNASLPDDSESMSVGQVGGRADQPSEAESQRLLMNGEEGTMPRVLCPFNACTSKSSLDAEWLHTGQLHQVCNSVDVFRVGRSTDLLLHERSAAVDERLQMLQGTARIRSAHSQCQTAAGTHHSQLCLLLKLQQEEAVDQTAQSRTRP